MAITEGDLAFVESLAREAGALLMRYRQDGFTISHKAAINLVTTADHESERLIVGALSARYPSHVIISEEAWPSSSPVVHFDGGEQEPVLSGIDKTPPMDGDDIWYIDPLDGTTDFVHGYPVFAVSIALYQNAQPLLGVIYDPIRDELFSAQRGAGAWLNGQPICVSQTRSLIASLLTSGFPYDVHESGSNIAAYQQLTLLSRGVRISGSAALDLAWVACGRLDGYWEAEIAPWDGAAGALLVREAGGCVSDYEAQAWQPTMASVVATNRWLHEALLKEIAVG